MHIPDGYLSPRTCAFFYALMLPAWYVSSRKVEKELKLKEIPLLALGASFAFVVMMLNIPIPGGSSGHMVGAVVVSVALGPWAGVIALTIALTLQAFIFADGGITTLGANSFNMALVMSFSGYYIYGALAGRSPGRPRRGFASALAAYIALNLAALFVAVELGIQPAIAHGADGRPLYAPYPLSIAIPAMMLPHLLFFGPVEALGTALIISYIYKTDEGLIKRREGLKPLWAVLIFLIVLTPLGLIAAVTPWGEWGSSGIKELIGYVPAGMEVLGGVWKGLLPGYTFTFYGAGRGASALFYVLSAAIGSGMIVLIVYLWGRLWPK
ncbi:MAG: cobalt transporter CbiM [Deltaproteobacteria bacterium]|nr:cobalt transporter CbiM [Deltaproteobacteria bacterium]